MFFQDYQDYRADDRAALHDARLSGARWDYYRAFVPATVNGESAHASFHLGLSDSPGKGRDFTPWCGGALTALRPPERCPATEWKPVRELLAYSTHPC